MPLQVEACNERLRIARAHKLEINNLFVYVSPNALTWVPAGWSNLLILVHKVRLGVNRAFLFKCPSLLGQAKSGPGSPRPDFNITGRPLPCLSNEIIFKKSWQTPGRGPVSAFTSGTSARRNGVSKWRNAVSVWPHLRTDENQQITKPSDFWWKILTNLLLLCPGYNRFPCSARLSCTYGSYYYKYPLMQIQSCRLFL